MRATTTRLLSVSAAALLLLGCDKLDVADLNNPGLETLDNPSPAFLNNAASGLLIGARVQWNTPFGWVMINAVLGREGFSLNVNSDPRYVTELILGPFNGGGYGGLFWGVNYANVRNANNVIAAADRVVGMTDQEKSGIKGFARTILAMEFLRLILTRDANGIVIDVPEDPTAPPGPLATKAQAYARIAELLDQGKTDLQAAGGSFSFPLGSGFAGFDTPLSFLKFNRGLRARAAVYSNDWTAALAALPESFIDPAGSLTSGVYFVFTTGSGDLTNQLYDPTAAQRVYANPALVTEAQRRANNSPDLRVTQKIGPAAGGTYTAVGVTSDVQFTIYNSITAPIPVMRNEELILLRAEANLGLGNLSQALVDINLIRDRSGGLAPYSGPVTAGAVLDELLYNKRYSLVFEGGFSWFDFRHYDKLPALGRVLPNGKFFKQYLFPNNECLSRENGGAGIPGCTEDPGF